MSAADAACRIAINLARNAGYAVFPCRAGKAPACQHGFKDASRDPAAIQRLWHRFPGELIGVATGTASGVSVLDVDPKHRVAYDWWQRHHPRLLPTRTYRTRSGGLHLYFRHREGVTNSQGKIASGIDTRGEGGYVIYWFATGFECLDQSPAVEWPVWLFNELKKSPPLPLRPAARARTSDPDKAIDGILGVLREAREGDRNGKLFWAACRLYERGLPQTAIEAMLLPIARDIGLSDPRENVATIRSATRRAVA
jgi:hypothetical protein